MDFIAWLDNLGQFRQTGEETTELWIVPGEILDAAAEIVSYDVSRHCDKIEALRQELAVILASGQAKILVDELIHIAYSLASSSFRQGWLAGYRPGNQ